MIVQLADTHRYICTFSSYAWFLLTAPRSEEQSAGDTTVQVYLLFLYLITILFITNYLMRDTQTDRRQTHALYCKMIVKANLINSFAVEGTSDML